jgi:hypothetical protein
MLYDCGNTQARRLRLNSVTEDAFRIRSLHAETLAHSGHALTPSESKFEQFCPKVELEEARQWMTALHEAEVFV